MSHTPREDYKIEEELARQVSRCFLHLATSMLRTVNGARPNRSVPMPNLRALHKEPAMTSAAWAHQPANQSFDGNSSDQNAGHSAGAARREIQDLCGPARDPELASF